MIDKIFTVIFQLFSNVTYAVQIGDPGGYDTTCPKVSAAGEPPKIADLVCPVERIFDYILPIGALIAVAMIIYGGYMWIISGGDPSRKQMAQGTLTWSVIGLVFLFLIKAILTLITEFVVG